MVQTKKRSKKREAILACIKATQVHPSAEWVYTQLKPQIPDLSLATVYRNLALFLEEGSITSLGVVQGLERFDGNTTPHVHFICTGCGAVLDLPSLAVPTELEAQVAEALGASVTAATLSFRGLCGECQKRKLPGLKAEACE